MFGRNTHGHTVLMDSAAVNSAFSDCGHYESAASFVIPSGLIGSDPFTFSEISVLSVYFYLQHLDVKKSMGPDALSARFLRSIANEIAVPLQS